MEKITDKQITQEFKTYIIGYGDETIFNKDNRDNILYNLQGFMATIQEYHLVEKYVFDLLVDKTNVRQILGWDR